MVNADKVPLIIPGKEPASTRQGYDNKLVAELSRLVRRFRQVADTYYQQVDEGASTRLYSCADDLERAIAVYENFQKAQGAVPRSGEGGVCPR